MVGPLVGAGPRDLAIAMGFMNAYSSTCMGGRYR